MREIHEAREVNEKMLEQSLQIFFERLSCEISEQEVNTQIDDLLKRHYTSRQKLTPKHKDIIAKALDGLKSRKEMFDDMETISDTLDHVNSLSVPDIKSALSTGVILIQDWGNTEERAFDRENPENPITRRLMEKYKYLTGMEYSLPNSARGELKELSLDPATPPTAVDKGQIAKTRPPF